MMEDAEMYVDRVALRDAFAMAALTGLCARLGSIGNFQDGVANTAYSLADAMLAAREAK